MPIIKEVPKPCKHLGMPPANDYGEGTIWECDNKDCRYQFIVRTYNDLREGSYNIWEFYIYPI